MVSQHNLKLNFFKSAVNKFMKLVIVTNVELVKICIKEAAD